MSVVAEYFERVKTVYATGEATEHSYRPALEFLFKTLDDGLTVVNEPKRTDFGAPDFIFQRDGVPIGYCEAKDIDKDIRALKGYSVEQKQRYLAGFPNLLYTNGVDFDFYRDQELIRSISIADFLMGLQAKPERFEELEHQLQAFLAERPRTITSSKRLATMMAAKAVLIKDVLGRALIRDLKDGEETELVAQYEAFREHLIHDITSADFADLYAETIAYGMFAARLHDNTLDTFSRSEALELLPKSNPFLRSLFGYIAGPELDDRIEWIIDDLAKIFLACNLKEIMADFGRLTAQNDPFLHFYETFLSAYNPKKRKARGVWYTPEPVVNFIVRAVDEVLQTEFGLPDGLADTSKVQIEFDTGQVRRTSKGDLSKRGERHIVKKDVHRVQILDPATGTGTFLAEVIKQISAKVKNVAPGHWSQYVEEELIPRVHGFELLMASYAMCHLKLDMILTELGYKPSGTPPRLSVYLTNSLEEGEPVDQSLFAQWLAREAKQANTIKNDMPIMVVIGNPPYSISSTNKGEWIQNLVNDYKKNLSERSLNALSDDYVKFIRFAEYMINKNGVGVFGFISNNSFLDGVVHRKMRMHLIDTFDSIYVLNLHGDSNKKEKAPGGGLDQNVFDIRQGVAITIGVKSGKSERARVFVEDIYGSRDVKYNCLEKSGFYSTKFKEVDPVSPRFMFVDRDFGDVDEYENGFSLNKFIPKFGSGIKFRKDKLLITNNFTESDAMQMTHDVTFLPTSELTQKYDFNETKDWIHENQRKNFENANSDDIIKITYRPFDNRFTFYPINKIGEIIPRGDSRRGLMRHMFNENVAIICGRQNKSGDINQFFVSNYPSEMKAGERTIQSYHFPLYLYPQEDSLDQSRRINFDPKLYKKLRKLAAHPEHGEPDEVAVFDYIYGVLHSPDYRETFKEFLKVDFPRIPWPQSPDVFWSVAEKGGQLRRLHLMEPAALGETPYPFEGEGDGTVDKPKFEELGDGTGWVFINETQSFRNVPRIAWEFHIGGYQPARKWLKDRKGRALSFADLQHYQRIIKILAETGRIMKEMEGMIPIPSGDAG
ncbi:type ISP restriction/modification enzyme [Marinicauda sp. Alg238-R41]|uniref:type ISP restriction/modification enzyme n=1 Tax=Marinicauda sp. Alg238-R41 TaxID=2993447 RepID=UPI0022E15F3B|nr:type ISP restriction/modification enzyme [Marinicauda sp. Alg238-R41]